MSVSIPVSTLRWAVPLAVLTVIGLIVLWTAAYTVDETEQVVIIQFGRPVGNAIDEPGLHFKKPFIQEVRRFDKRILAWDGDPRDISTRGREFIFVDSTARWRIVDPLLFLKSVKDESGAQSRLDDIVDSVVRDKISSTILIEIVRSQDWQVDEQELERAGISEKDKEILQKKIEVGREQLEREILAQSQKIMPKYGIELVDVRIQRLNYVPSVQQQVFNRMISERQRIATQFRSEGEERSTDILGQTEKQVALIRSEAQREAEIIRGQADAKATEIYNEAYGLDPEFFAFYRTLESYSKSLGKDATLIIATDSDYFRYLRRITPAPSAK